MLAVLSSLFVDVFFLFRRMVKPMDAHEPLRDMDRTIAKSRPVVDDGFDERLLAHLDQDGYTRATAIVREEMKCGRAEAIEYIDTLRFRGSKD